MTHLPQSPLCHKRSPDFHWMIKTKKLKKGTHDLCLYVARLPTNTHLHTRILRNRAAAQESRDKKRRYVSDLESSNKKLTEENEHANKKVKTLQDQNAILNSQLEAFTRQLATLQAQIKFNASTPILFNDFCDSARIAKKEGLKASCLKKKSPLMCA